MKIIVTKIVLISFLTSLFSCNSLPKSNEKEIKSKTDTGNIQVNKDDESSAVSTSIVDAQEDSKVSGFVMNLKSGEKLNGFFKENWLFVYHEDNRCDGSTDGKLDKLKSSMIDSVISLEVKNNGDGWDCDKKESKTFVLDFDIRKKVMDWDRFEVPNYDNQEENVVYVQGSGESAYLILHIDHSGLITKLEYRSEDPG